jgi:serine/threonine protein kinase
VNRSLLNQKYVPLRQIAAGGMGEIFLARQTGEMGFQREVVLKVIRRDLGKHPRAVEMFLDEARLAAALNHPNIVQILDVGEDQEGYFIVMERMLGSTLRDVAESTTRLGRMIPLELSLNIIIQVLEGLRYAHGFHDESGRPLKIVHRDIGPTNIFLSNDGAVKILDFGIARAENQLRDETGMRPGKYAYMSPEMVRGEPVDARSDLFSVGVLLYEITVGQRLFRASSFETMQRQVHDPVPPPTYSRAGYPADLENIVMRALELEPEDRFESAEVMLEQLEHFAFDSGLRLSRLRLGRFISRVMGVTSSMFDFDLLQEPESPAVEQHGEELDFDRTGLFDEQELSRTARDQGERQREGVEAMQQASEAIAELVTASEQEESLSENDDEEGKTVEIPPYEKAELVARSSSSEPSVSVLRESFARDLSAAEDAPSSSPAITVKRRESSVVVVTDELVEEELDLVDPRAEPWIESTIPEASSATALRSERELEVTVRVPRDVLEVIGHQEAQATAARSSRESSVPEASADLKEALADISAELKAAEDEDRRRVEALSQAIDLLGEATISSPPKQETGVDKLLGSLERHAAVEVQATVSSDELERADSPRSRPPDALELVDMSMRPARDAEVVDLSEIELEAEGETILLTEDDSAVEVEVSGLHLEPAEDEEGLDDQTLELLRKERPRSPEIPPPIPPAPQQETGTSLRWSPTIKLETPGLTRRPRRGRRPAGKLQRAPRGVTHLRRRDQEHLANRSPRRSARRKKRALRQRRRALRARR